MHIVLLGCPGAGKGTQAKSICESEKLTHISTGDLFRAEMAKASPLGKKAAEYVKRGTLVPDELVVEMVAAKLNGLSGGWLLDGFPRNLEQAQALDKYLRAAGARIDVVIYLALSEKDVVARLSSRRTCSKCGESFNVISRKPKADGVCDSCGGKLIQRDDDTEATIRKRLMVFNDLTQPLVAYYRSGNAFHEVDGALEPSGVTAVIGRVLAGLASAGKGGR
ncbi:MAG: adenylate kinase [Elusimicrobiota bacterium]